MRHLGFAIALAFVFTPACAVRSNDDKCTYAYKTVDLKLKNQAKEIADGKLDAAAEQRRADATLAEGVKTCTDLRAANAPQQIALMQTAAKAAKASIDDEAARRKKDPNIEKRGPAPHGTWDGSISIVERAIKDRMKDPSSYEHVSTMVPLEDGPRWRIKTNYRGKNSFGALVLNSTVVFVQNGVVVEVKN